MRFKVSPEVVRLMLAVTAFIQLLGAGLTGTDVLPEKALVLLVVIGSALAGALALYSQGVQTEPPHGAITEDYAAQAAVEAAPNAEQPATYAKGRAAAVPVDEWPAAERVER